MDLLDIALIAGFLWLAIRYFRNTRARPALAARPVAAGARPDAPHAFAPPR